MSFASSVLREEGSQTLDILKEAPLKPFVPLTTEELNFIFFEFYFVKVLVNAKEPGISAVGCFLSLKSASAR